MAPADGFVKVAKVEEIPPGTGKPVVVGDVKVALFNVGGSFHAIDNVCPHQGGALGEGFLKGHVVTCPFHFWQFDIKTGRCPEFPEARVSRFAVRVEGSEISVSPEPLDREI